MRRITADCIYTMTGEPIPNGMLELDDDGRIIDIYHSVNSHHSGVERFEGVITPGFVNAHCHLELSHMKGKIKEGSGLVNFIKAVIKNRGASDTELREAMQKADEAMWEQGIVAVGDISNVAASAEIKKKSKIRYHTFVEMLGMDPAQAPEIFENALNLSKAFDGAVSITPHAAYSTSKQLLKELKKYCKLNANLISIHNQENDEENKLFRYKTGKFIDFYREMGINIEHFVAMSKNALQAILPLLPDNQKILMVHNTFTNLKDVYTVKRFPKEIFWCFCPKANLYIEETLPNFRFFESVNEDTITLGTDSLASNDTLSILEEMKAITKKNQDLKLSQLIKWSTFNGAKFLGMDQEFGTLQKGRKPGINLISHVENNRLTDKSTVTRLA